MSKFEDIVRQVRGEPAIPATPDHGFAELDRGESEIIRLRLRRPIVAGSIVVLVLVFGLLLWAFFSTITGAVVAAAQVRVEGNSKVIKHRDGGIIRHIYVREGQFVRRGQMLMQLDPIQAQSTVEVWQAQYDSALADIARLQAQQAGSMEIRFPPELLARQSNPQVAALLVGQRALHNSTMMLYRSQASVLQSQALQVQTQIQGMRAQMASVDMQSGSISDELSGVRELNRLGYAPKTRVSGLERGAAQLKGQKGSILSDMARAQQGIGGIRIQIAQLEEKRQAEAASGIRVDQDKLTEAAPKLRATSESLYETVVRAPVDGYVFNLTQFTEGGVAQPSERLLDIVPRGTPLVLNARVRPNDIAEVRVGMPARITLTAFNPRTTPQLDGRVTLVAADATVDEQGATREQYYAVQIKVDPGQLAKIGNGVHMTPGMQAQVNIVTGSRTIMDYLLGPMTEAMRTALRER
ncbi:HlyD family type I secretion periplasmic adaptor subunit [Sphingomonas crusticola]|uniref:HlyD family type I secretion periplasmic adaptor subunit n=1 Tax=Sphingomonas crusticola TaxID=1697973 RepID=UPI001F07A172|nr:HlyD family type I secretion periplasmic adaptor subunit [Sphingomonas crusticola]